MAGEYWHARASILVCTAHNQAKWRYAFPCMLIESLFENGPWLLNFQGFLSQQFHFKEIDILARKKVALHLSSNSESCLPWKKRLANPEPNEDVLTRITGVSFYILRIGLAVSSSSSSSKPTRGGHPAIKYYVYIKVNYDIVRIRNRLEKTLISP